MQISSAARRGALALGVAAALGAGQAQASSDNQFYGGVLITFGADQVVRPLLQVGFRQASVKQDGDADGWDLSLTAGLEGLESLRLAGHKGSRCTQGEITGGFNFRENSLLFGFGVQSNYIRTGLDVMLAGEGGLSPYLGANSIGCYDRQRTVAPEDPNGYGGLNGYGGIPQL
ncbi:MAG: hypothetical protein JJT85_10730 [Chromatiales bacterium]|nr:hypothetical protein [Chromatiales bacterium]